MRRNIKTSFRLLSDFTNNVWEFISMNKTQFGVLILSTLLSQAVHIAHASELSVYGLGHLSADMIDDGQLTSNYVTSNSSRLGVSGSYALNENLEAIFQYETGVDLTAQGFNDGNGGADSAGQIFTKGRESYVGLRGNFGKILIGHMPALDQWANDYNLFADQVGDLGNFWEASGVPGRLDNVIYYQTPNYNNFDIAVTYTPEEGEADSDKTIIKSSYNSSDLMLGLAYARIGQSDSFLNDHTSLALTFGYDFGRFTFGGGFQNESDIMGIAGVERDSYSLGGSVKIGHKGILKSQIAFTNSDSENADAQQFAIGYDYLLDKNITIYIAYARTDNDQSVNFSVNGKGHGDKVVPALGDDPNVISLGLVVKFNLSFGLD